MLHFQNELMMAVIVASTAFLGFTVAFIGQVVVPETKHELGKVKIMHLGWGFPASFITGIVAIMLGLLWFVTPNVWVAGLAAIALVFQVNLFWPLVFWVWKII